MIFLNYNIKGVSLSLYDTSYVYVCLTVISPSTEKQVCASRKDKASHCCTSINHLFLIFTKRVKLIKKAIRRHALSRTTLAL